jgi:hypothetical protein
MEQDLIIVTNNKLLSNELAVLDFVEGDFFCVLMRVRDLVHEGHALISHPIGASMRMMFSPCRSVIVGPKTQQFNQIHAITIENSIDIYKRSTQHRAAADLVNKADYERIDLELLKEAIREHQTIQSEKKQEVHLNES